MHEHDELSARNPRMGHDERAPRSERVEDCAPDSPALRVRTDASHRLGLDYVVCICWPADRSGPWNDDCPRHGIDYVGPSLPPNFKLSSVVL